MACTGQAALWELGSKEIVTNHTLLVGVQITRAGFLDGISAICNKVLILKCAVPLT